MMVLTLTLLCFQVETGLDFMVASRFASLKGKTVAILTNHSALDRTGKHLVDLLPTNRDFHLKAFLAPEHGFQGRLDRENLADGEEETTGCTIYSLYGKNRKPSAAMLAGVDVLLFDIQDIGTRFYTYQTTMLYAMQACAEFGVDFMVLDRPNPLGGLRCEGPVLDSDLRSFVGAFPMPVLHGMTMGELATLFQAQLGLNLKLTVVPCKGWRRDWLFDRTGLVWIDPSPNIRNLKQAILYPAIGLLEYTNLSVGRGTDTPFEHFGAPWLEAVPLARKLNAAGLAGIRFVPHFFVPESGPYKGESCGGVYLMLTDARTFDPILTSYTIFQMLHQQAAYAGERYLKLLGNRRSFEALMKGEEPAQIRQQEQQQIDLFREKRRAALLYPERH